MNRTGLTIALAIGLVAGLICAVDPQLDLDLAGMAYNPARDLFAVNAQPWVQYTREAARGIITLLVLPAFIAILGKLILPRRRMPIGGRAALFSKTIELVAERHLALNQFLAGTLERNGWDWCNPIRARFR